MKTFHLSYKKAYLIFLFILVLMSATVIMYVAGLLQKYEDMLPEQRVVEAIAVLGEDASDENFFSKYGLPEIQTEKFEAQRNVKKEYLGQFHSANITFSLINNKSDSDTLCYAIKNGERKIAEVKVKAVGEVESKLVVLHYREWQIVEIKPILEKEDYTVVVPVAFAVNVNNIALTNEDGVEKNDGRLITYTISGVYLEPNIVISDDYGNQFTYNGKGEIPFTYMTVLADSRYTVVVDGKEVAKESVTTYIDKEFETLVDFVADLPQISQMDIAILKKDAKVIIEDESGNPVNYEPGKEVYDFTDTKHILSEVPKEVSSEIDVLTTAHNWSLFMSNDKKFAEIKNSLINGSYQYKKAYQYATGIDIHFVSPHTFADPKFTGNTVSNFTWITENCFSVDVSFVKHMILPSGKRVDDAMNHRFYYVKYDDTDDGIDNPAWKIASMREIITDGNE